MPRGQRIANRSCGPTGTAKQIVPETPPMGGCGRMDTEKKPTLHDSFSSASTTPGTSTSSTPMGAPMLQTQEVDLKGIDDFLSSFTVRSDAPTDQQASRTQANVASADANADSGGSSALTPSSAATEESRASTAEQQGKAAEDSMVIADPFFAQCVGELLHKWANAPGVKRKSSSFDSATCPSLSLHDYVALMFTYMRCSAESYVAAVVYIDRLVQRQKFVISERNIHRLLLTAVVLAAKFQDDYFCDNRYYSMVGGIALPELNLLERRMVKMLGYRLQVTPEEYDTYHEVVMNAFQ